mmetsp:Transcript_86475/g.242045  ORF Transcript_86475/g.242045 Transcript_86475/m.242045 type:complete len:418 (-) Transcript_86475:103-1356(-)
MQHAEEIGVALARGHDEIRNVSDPDGVGQLAFCGGNHLPERNARASKDEAGRQDQRQESVQSSSEALSNLVHRHPILRAASLPILAEVAADIVLEVIIQAMVENHELGYPPSILTGRTDVDVPSVRVCMHPPVDKDHLREGVANQGGAILGVEADGAERVGVVRLRETLAELHGQHALRRKFPEHPWHVDARREMRKLCGGGLAGRGLELEIKLAREVFLEVLHDPHQVIAPRHLLDLSAHRLEDGEIRGHLLPELRVLHFHCDAVAVPQHCLVHLRERRCRNGLVLEAGQRTAAVQGRGRPVPQRYALHEDLGNLGRCLVRGVVGEDRECLGVLPWHASVASASTDRRDELRCLHIKAPVHRRHLHAAIRTARVAAVEGVPVLLGAFLEILQAALIVLLLHVELHHGHHAPRHAQR